MISETNSPPLKLNMNQGQNQMMNQYFNQKKHLKFQQIDSPKDSSIERVRHFDMIQQESQSIPHYNHGDSGQIVTISNATEMSLRQNKSDSANKQIPRASVMDKNDTQNDYQDIEEIKTNESP